MSKPQPLPARPDLHWLKNRAKERLDALRGRDPAARLSEAQLEIARDYGFPSWRALKSRVDELRAALETEAPLAPPTATLPDEVVKAFLRAVGAGEIDKVRQAIAAASAFVNAVGPHPYWGANPSRCTSRSKPTVLNGSSSCSSTAPM